MRRGGWLQRSRTAVSGRYPESIARLLCEPLLGLGPTLQFLRELVEQYQLASLLLRLHHAKGCHRTSRKTRNTGHAREARTFIHLRMAFGVLPFFSLSDEIASAVRKGTAHVSGEQTQQRKAKGKSHYCCGPKEHRHARAARG